MTVDTGRDGIRRESMDQVREISKISGDWQLIRNAQKLKVSRRQHQAVSLERQHADGIFT